MRQIAGDHNVVRAGYLQIAKQGLKDPTAVLTTSMESPFEIAEYALVQQVSYFDLVLRR